MRRLILEWMYAYHRLDMKRQGIAGSLYAHLGGLDVVVEVVAECLDVRNDIWHPLGCQVSGEKYLSQSAAYPKTTHDHKTTHQKSRSQPRRCPYSAHLARLATPVEDRCGTTPVVHFE